MKKLIIFLLFISCARAPLKNKEDAMKLSSSSPKNIIDSKANFFETLKSHIAHMRGTRLMNDPLVFGSKKISKKVYIDSLEKILKHQDDYADYIREQFDFYEVYGKDDWGDVLVTGYYEPFINGSMLKTNEYSRALYLTPPDLVSVDLKLFNEKYPGFKNLDALTGRLQEKNIVPYYDRKQIDGDNVLEGKKLEICWVKPIDAFFLQIQGSGVVHFADGSSFRVGYASQNGQPYFSIGKAMTDKIPMTEMSMQKIKLELLKMPLVDQQNLLNKNKSYVFFKKLEGKALTYTGIEVSDGRTVATDTHFFPKGAMGYLDIDEPVFQNADEHVPFEWKHAPRFVFDQDTGGAIKGGYRVDLFIGSGATAEQTAGVLKREGKFYYLVPKLKE